MNSIDGVLVSSQTIEGIKKQISELTARAPHLVVVVVGNDPASSVYVRNKIKKCEYVGMRSTVYSLDEKTSEKELIELIKNLNENQAVDGILVQLPLPYGIDATKVIESIDPKKDVDGFHPYNLGLMFANHPKAILPCTPKGIIRLLEYYQFELSGKKAVIIGRSLIVGKPIAMLLLSKNATVTICHTKTKELKSLCLQADLLIVAAGQAEMIDQSYIKKDAIVVDVGIHRHEGRLVGDCNPDVALRASWLTPVPGGVGPMTIAMLLENTLELYLRKGDGIE